MSAQSAEYPQHSPKGPQNGTQGQPEWFLRQGEHVIPAKLAGNRLRFTLQDETHNVPILKVEAENRPESRSAESTTSEEKTRTTRSSTEQPPYRAQSGQLHRTQAPVKPPTPSSTAPNERKA